jgi:cytochrome c peroxidase
MEKKSSHFERYLACLLFRADRYPWLCHPFPFSLSLTSTTMTFSSLFCRAQPLRRAAFSTTISHRATRAGLKFRRFSTAAPPPKSNTTLYVGIGAAAVGGFALYYFTNLGNETNTTVKSASQTAKSAVGFVPTKEDYQKVCPAFALDIQ